MPQLLPAAQDSRALAAASSEEGEEAELGGRRQLALPVGAAALVLALVAAAAVYSTSEDGSGLGQRQRLGPLKAVGADARAVALQELDVAEEEANTSGDGTGGMVGTEGQPDSRCGHSVCYTGATCCPNTSGGLCGSPGSICCGSSICAPGSTCCGKHVCAAPGSTCCGDSGVCSPGSTCCPSGLNGSSMCCSDGFQCCPPGSGLSGCCPIAASLNNVTSCGAMKCAGGSICCKDRLCGTPQSVCCGNIVCAPGATCCGTGICASPKSTCCGNNICGPMSSCCDSTTGQKMCCGPSSQCCPKDSGLKGCCPRTGPHPTNETA
ncbi:unnamed protein product [Prorocentrum cordatum]|uniref:Granulins domain-containing protein n=1 Tax=Prorocentrum cordatum TaxID=2364126 RepID=A0ABN9QMU0_9DINO|nr:unnamed protein product [Polarella glacialis]